MISNPGKSGLKIDGHALFFPIAVAGGIEPLLLAGGRRGRVGQIGLRHRRRRAQIGRRVEMLGAFHRPQMERGRALAKR